MLRGISQVARLSAIGVSALVLAGWILRIDVLMLVPAGMPTMAASTAVCVLLLGLCLFLLGEFAQRDGGSLRGICWVRTSALIALAIAAWSVANESSWGAMAPITAAGIALIACAALAASTKRERLDALADGLAFAAALIGGLVLLAHLFQVRALHGIGPFSAMSVPSAASLFALGHAALFARPDRGLTAVLSGNLASARLARRLLAAVFLLFPLLGWIRWFGEGAGWYGTAFGLALMVASGMLVFTALIWLNARAAAREDKKLVQLSRMYAMLSQTNQAVIRISEPADLARTVCRIAVDFGGFSLAAVAAMDAGPGSLRVVAARAGGRPGEEPAAAILGELSGEGTQTGERLMRGEALFINDVAADSRLARKCQQTLAFGGRSLAAVPFSIAGAVRGLVLVCAEAREAFVADEAALLREMAADIGFALEHLDNERRFRATFEQAAVGIAHVAPDGRWLRINRRLCEVVGYTREELLARTLQDITHPDDLDADLGYVRQMLARQIETYSTQKRYLRKDGSIVWISLTVALVWTDDGGPDYFMSVVEDISARKAAEEALHESEERFRRESEVVCALSARLLGAQESERAAIARELHDEIGQALSAALLNLHALQRSGGAEMLKVRLDRSVDAVNNTLQQVRALSLNLRPPQLDDLGIVAALRALVDRRAAGLGPQVHLRAPDLPALPPPLDIICYRVVQEALNNAVKHADATNVWIELCLEGATLNVAVRDDGKGFDSAPAQERARSGLCMGVFDMEERVQLGGGRLRIETRPGAGTSVCAELPLKK